MPGHVKWLIPNRVIYVKIAGDYHLETVKQVVAAATPMVDSGTAPVHVVWDMTEITKMPTDIREPISQLQNLRDHPNGGWITMIANSVMIRFAGQIASRLLGANYRSVSTFDEAIQTLSRIDLTIADDLNHLPEPSLD